MIVDYSISSSTQSVFSGFYQLPWKIKKTIKELTIEKKVLIAAAIIIAAGVLIFKEEGLIVGVTITYGYLNSKKANNQISEKSILGICARGITVQKSLSTQ